METLLTQQELTDAQDILIEELGVTREQLTPEARLIEDLGADSLTIAEITMHAEEHFNLAIPDEEAEKVSTVDDFLTLLGERLHAVKR